MRRPGRKTHVSRVGRARPGAPHGRGAPLGHRGSLHAPHTRGVERGARRGRRHLALGRRLGRVVPGRSRRPGGRALGRSDRPRVLDHAAGPFAPGPLGPPAGPRDRHPSGRRGARPLVLALSPIDASARRRGRRVACGFVPRRSTALRAESPTTLRVRSTEGGGAWLLQIGQRRGRVHNWGRTRRTPSSAARRACTV